jgi:TonB family protein
VASSNPQRTNSPDTGTARIVPPDTAGQSKPTEGQVPEPETVKPSGGDEGTSPEVTTAPRVDPDTTTQAPKGNPDARVEPVEAETTTPAPQRLAALPVPVTPGVPVAPSPEPPVIPVVPLESETLAPQTPEATLVPAPEDTETVQVEDDAVGSDLAVAVSPRPPTAPRRSTTEPLGLRDGSTDFSELQFPPLMESPLVTYQRGQTDLVIRQNGGVQSGGLGFVDSRGPGNSDVTNYAGRVLVHLNRSPPVRLSARGAARILFEINPDGTLGRIDIIDSTGSKEIERAARLQVQNAAPFPLPPQGASRRVTFVYWNN